MNKGIKFAVKMGLVATTTLAANMALAATFKTPGVYIQETSAIEISREAELKTASSIEGLELLDTIGRYEQELMVYTTAKPTQEDVERLIETSAKLAGAAGIQLSEKMGRLGENRIAFRGEKDPSASFEIDQITGNFIFNSGLNQYREEETTKNLPREGELEGLAFKALEQFGLNADIKQLAIEHVGGLNMGVTDGSGGTLIYEKLKTVRFDRVLGGIPVNGESRLVMHFGQDAALSGLIYQLPTIEQARPLPTDLVEEPEFMKELALEELESMAKKAERSKLTSVELVLYDDGKGVIEPAYHIVLERFIDDGNRDLVMIPYDFYVPVSRKPQAFFPSMEVAAVSPENGSGTGKVESTVDE
jgi:hypothetical protein